MERTLSLKAVLDPDVAEPVEPDFREAIAV